MKWPKGKIIELIKGNDGRVRGVKLNVYQKNLNKNIVINRPLQLIVPFEIADYESIKTSEPAESIAVSRPRRSNFFFRKR